MGPIRWQPGVAFYALCSQLQDQVDVLARLALPAGAQLEAQRDASMHISEYGDVQSLSLSKQNPTMSSMLHVTLV
jgi:hypothetical protein